MRLVLLVVIAAVIVLTVLYVVDLARKRSAGRAPWKVDTFNRADGTTVVALRREGSGERVIKELPPGMDPVEFESEVRIALEDAESHAKTLNRR